MSEIIKIKLRTHPKAVEIFYLVKNLTNRANGKLLPTKNPKYKVIHGSEAYTRENILAANSKIPLPESPKNVEKYPSVSCISKKERSTQSLLNPLRNYLPVKLAPLNISNPDKMNPDIIKFSIFIKLSKPIWLGTTNLSHFTN